MLVAPLFLKWAPVKGWGLLHRAGMGKLGRKVVSVVEIVYLLTNSNGGSVIKSEVALAAKVAVHIRTNPC